jgi:hypothetical protein
MGAEDSERQTTFLQLIDTEMDVDRATLDIRDIEVPLRVDDAEAVRVGSSRVLFHLVVRAWKDGATPEAIQDAYSTLELPDIYGAITYYLQHREQVEAFLDACDEEARQVREKIEDAGFAAEVSDRMTDQPSAA